MRQTSAIAGPHDAQIERQIDEAEGGDRQHQMAGDVRGTGKPCLARGDGFDAGQRQPAQLHGKDHGQHQPEPEAGHGVERQRADRQEPVAKAARPRAGDDAEHRAEAEGQRGGAAHQQQRVGQPLEDHVEDRPREGDRPAEIEMDERPEIGGEPRRSPTGRAPSAGAAPRSGRHRRRSTRIGVDGVAGRRLEQQERADDDDQQHRDAPISRGEQEQRTSHAGRPDLWISTCPRSYHVSSQVSAQFDTAQRGLLETFLTLVARHGDEAPFGDIDQRQVGGDEFLEIACRARCALAASRSRAALAISASSSALA